MFRVCKNLQEIVQVMKICSILGYRNNYIRCLTFNLENNFIACLTFIRWVFSKRTWKARSIRNSRIIVYESLEHSIVQFEIENCREKSVYNDGLLTKECDSWMSMEVQILLCWNNNLGWKVLPCDIHPISLF